MMMKAGERGPQATQNKAAEEESLAAANEISAGVAVVLTVFHACFFFFFCIRHLEALLVEKKYHVALFCGGFQPELWNTVPPCLSLGGGHTCLMSPPLHQ